jgi:stage IV sporulation protein A
MEEALMEFPLKSIEVELPKWMQALPPEHEIIQKLIGEVRAKSDALVKMKDYGKAADLFQNSEYVQPAEVDKVALGEGRLTYRARPKEGVFYKILSSECGCDIADDFRLMSYVRDTARAKSEYDKLKGALDEVNENGYGVVTPTMDQMELAEPEIMKSGNRFGVKLKASAPSLHIMRVDIETEVSPIVGTEQQSEELVKYLLSEFENDPKGIWDTDMFGKSLHLLVKENLNNKLHSMPVDTQKKMRKTIQRIVNEGKGGVLCILL